MTTLPKRHEHLVLWFTPDAIREHFSFEDTPESRWVAQATDEQLEVVGEWAINGDYLYEAFRWMLRTSVEYSMKEEARA